MATNKSKTANPKREIDPQLIIDSQRKEFNEKFYQKLKHNISEERYQEAKLNQKGLR